ncbi:MAG: hypothetical protein ACSHXY_00490 [Alphaproteobacteria bacterium]
MLKTLTISSAIFMLTSSFVTSASAQLYNPAPAPTADATSQYGVYVYPKYFPKEISGVGFTMPKSAFLKTLKEKNVKFQAGRDNDKFLVTIPGADFTGVIYDFSSNAGEILTEIEMRFADAGTAKTYFDANYSPQHPNGDFGVFNETAPFRAKAWQFGHKIFFVAVMADTRWSNQ